MTIRLYQFEQSPFCDKIRRVLHVKGQRFEVTEIPPSQALSRIKKLNPIGKLPCLEIDGHLMGDSTDIAHHLESLWPDPALVPEDPRDAALCHLIEDWADESLYFYQARMRFTFPHNARHQVPAMVRHDSAVAGRLASLVLPNTFKAQLHQQGIGRKPDAMVVRDVRRHVEALRGWLGQGDWLVGESLTLADIGVFVQLERIRRTDEGDRLIESQPLIDAWMSRVEAATSAR